MNELMDIGHGVTIQFWAWNEDVPHGGGLIEEHDSLTEPGKRCEGSITFATPEACAKAPEMQMWVLEQVEPLTLSPSLLCTQCGHHGFIRDGRWVPA